MAIFRYFGMRTSVEIFYPRKVHKEVNSLSDDRWLKYNQRISMSY